MKSKKIGKEVILIARRAVISLCVLLILFSFVGCQRKEILSMESFVKAFADEGITVDVSEKPLFTLIGAKDGVIFYINQQKVAIYEYESKKQLNEVISQLPLPDIATWQTNGNFLLETQNEQAAKIFNKTK